MNLSNDCNESEMKGNESINLNNENDENENKNDNISLYDRLFNNPKWDEEIVQDQESDHDENHVEDHEPRQMGEIARLLMQINESSGDDDYE